VKQIIYDTYTTIIVNKGTLRNIDLGSKDLRCTTLANENEMTE
jgi:hypothetical protein